MLESVCLYRGQTPRNIYCTCPLVLTKDPRDKYVRTQARPLDAWISALNVSCFCRPNAIDVVPGLLIFQADCCDMSPVSRVSRALVPDYKLSL